MNRLTTVLALCLLCTAGAMAQVPRTISFQGVLADAQGVLLPDNTYTLTLSIYDQATGGSAIFSESQQVQVLRGVFNAIIGSTSPSGIPAGLDFNSQYWLGVQVNNGTELAPRTPFTSVPYALNAATAQVAVRAINADTAAWALSAGSAMLADTAVSVRGGHVSAVNGQQGSIEILGAGSTTITRNGNQFVIRSTDTSGGGIRRIDNFDGSLVVDPPQGPFVTLFIREGGVQTYHLRDLVVTTEKIANQAVTNAKLAPNSVTTDKIMDGQVMTADIADLNVTNAKLGPNSVTTDKIMDGQVMTADIADLNVTNAKLGPNSVTTDKIMDGQVMTADIADLNVTNPKLGPNSVTTDKIMDGQVQTADIADLNVTNPKLGPNSVTTDKIMDGQVQTADIGLNQVIASRIGTEGAPGGRALMSNGTATPIWADPILMNIPYSATVNSADTLWSMNNTGSGPAGGFNVKNPASTASALIASTDGQGMAIHAEHTSTTGTMAAIHAVTNSTSSSAETITGVVTSTSPGGFSSGVRGINNGTGGLGIGVWGSQSGSGWGVYGQTPSGIGVHGATTTGFGVYGLSTNGTGVYGFSNNGVAGRFENTNPANTNSTLVALSSSGGDAVAATNTGTGKAGNFLISNPASGASALDASTNGSGRALQAINAGTGAAGFFQTTNAASAITAVQVLSNGALGSRALGVEHTGLGAAVEVSVSNTSNVNNAIQVNHFGLGRVALIQSTNAANPSNIVDAFTAGTGTVINAQNAGTAGRAGQFRNTNAANASNVVDVIQSGTGYGVMAQLGATAPFALSNVAAVRGHATGTGTGVAGTSTDGLGVYASSNNNDAVFAVQQIGAHAGVRGRADGAGGWGLYGQAFGTGAIGVYGTSASGNAGRFEITNGSGANAVEVTTNGNGIAALVNQAGGGPGLHVIAPAQNYADGILSRKGGGSGLPMLYGAAIRGDAGSAAGTIDGVQGYTNGTANAAGIFGSNNHSNTVGYAGLFYGRVRVEGDLSVTGNVSKGGGSFKIDHPLDPENKFLYHSFVESPEMMNIYNGTVILDANGEATVTMPEWFEALNRDFRYQLTAIGAPGPNLYVAEKISGNRFRIAGGAAGMEVSWQVTGVRQDAYANKHRIPVEELKSAEERGTYLHPDAFGIETRTTTSTTESMPTVRGASAPSSDTRSTK